MKVAISFQRPMPAWVESDPLRGRAVDALGLQATAARIADELLPGLSVFTNRARYYALLAWARRANGHEMNETHIHRLEVALAVREAKLHPKSDEEGGCRFIGSRNLPRAPRQTPFDEPPKDPRRAYGTPVWRGYRASMQNLGLLDDSYALTEDGNSLARRFAAACGRLDASGSTMLPDSACLSRMKSREGALIAERLGLRKKGKQAREDRSDTARRLATARELADDLNGSFSISAVLSRYERRPDREVTFTVSALRQAAVWERLAVGLDATFLLWLKWLSSPTKTAKLFSDARKRTRTQPELKPILVGETTAIEAIQSVRRALDLRCRLERHGDLALFDNPRAAEAFRIGEALVGSGSVDDVLKRIEDLHLSAKGDDAWIRPVGRGRELARDADDKWEVPTKASLHGYRLHAFGQLLSDLTEAR